MSQTETELSGFADFTTNQLITASYTLLQAARGRVKGKRDRQKIDVPTVRGIMQNCAYLLEGNLSTRVLDVE